MAEPKKGIGLLLVGKPDHAEPDVDDGADMAAARVDAMKAFIAAVAKGDPATADEAMQAYHHVCGLSEPDSDDY